MDYKIACDILELKYDCSICEIKKAYYRMAIRYHPDKNPDGEEQFKKINSAYIYLQGGSSTDENREKMKYMDFIRKIINPKCEWDELFVSTTIKNILIDCENGALKVFQHLNKENMIKIYKFVCKYSDILKITDDILMEMKRSIHKKMGDDNIIILNPRLEDLLNDKIYKLEINNHMFYIPLWHNEVCYDISGHDLIVKCIPEILSDITIDNYNNIHYNIHTTAQELLKNEELIIEMAEKKWTILSKCLKIIPVQTHILREQGMLRINPENLYDSNKRGHIYVDIHLS